MCTVLHGGELPVSSVFLCRSTDFRPSYGRLHEAHALICHGVPFLAVTATATKVVRDNIIDT